MKRKFKLLILLFITLSLLSGCWSRKELDEMAIATALGIDKSGEDYLVTVQILNPGEIASQANTDRTEVTTYETTGKTIFEALRKLTTKSPRKIYFAHTRVIIFGEELAKDSIKKPLDLISRDHDFRTDFFILVAKDTEASNVLKVLTAINKIPANKIFSSLQTSENEWAPTKAVTIDELIVNFTNGRSSPVLTSIIIEGNSQAGNKNSNVHQIDALAKLKLTGLAGFKKDKLVGWLNQEESKGFNYITDNVESTVGYVPCEDEIIAVEVINSSTDVTGKVQKGAPKINIQVKSEANIGEVQCKKDVTKQEIIKELEEAFADKTKAIIENSIKKAKDDLESDIFGFGEAIYRANPQAWKEIKQDWEQYFIDLEIEIKVNFKIRSTGTIMESFQREKDE
ncbi:spore germination protein KC [Paraliobacillus quinghaiensis]|uniref:Spore germination protein KC n=1 Tax=Paraliobacillus quinghaiensis TaxID=470815 RepID=A0A917TIX5_9BACI|nr:Ger(x)C family spore germination protein [Paraliobacillus quinghaiensis]GGM24352.1 spore germination protein KC [Paraliobacillus quinghaiensis]